jgi:hypothetical protein
MEKAMADYRAQQHPPAETPGLYQPPHKPSDPLHDPTKPQQEPETPPEEPEEEETAAQCREPANRADADIHKCCGYLGGQLRNETIISRRYSRPLTYLPKI